MKLLHAKLIEYSEPQTLQLGMSESDVLYFFKYHFPFIQNVQIVFRSPYTFRARLFDGPILDEITDEDRALFLNFDLKYSDYDNEIVYLGTTNGALIKKNIIDREYQKTAIHNWFLALFEIYAGRNFKSLNMHVAGQKEHSKQEKRDFGFYTKEPLSFRLTGNYLNHNPEIRRKFRD
jgi:hypothetical protein